MDIPRHRSACLLLALCASAHACAQSLSITTELTPPAVMLDREKVIGYSTDKVRAMMARTGTAYTITLLPWARAYDQAQRQADTCVYSTTRTPEREGMFKWVGPMAEAEWILFGRADRQYHLRTLADARGLKIGAYNGDVRADYLRAHGMSVDSTQNDISNPQKLMFNRIDLWVSARRTVDSALADSKLQGKIVPVLTFFRAKQYLACNPAVPDALIARLNAANTAIHQDGSAARFERNYAHWHEPAKKAP